MQPKIVLLMGLLLLSGVHLAQADIYAYTDPTGVEHFTNQPGDQRYRLIVAVLREEGRDNRAQADPAPGNVARYAPVIAEAADRLSRAGTGAIIAVEGEVGLGDYLASGSPLTAKVSADLVTTIFTPYSPLHDGAVVIRGDQIIGAACVLPLTQFPVTDRSLGTRHRAALGLSEESDALVVVVSEETSQISVASRGLLRRGLAPQQIRELLSGQGDTLSDVRYPLSEGRAGAGADARGLRKRTSPTDATTDNGQRITDIGHQPSI